MSRPKRNVIKPTRFGNTLDYDELQNLIALPDEIDPAPAAAPAEDAGAAQPVAEVAAAVPAPAPVELAREGGNAAQGEIGAQASAGKQTKRARAISDDERDDAGSSQEKGGVYDRESNFSNRFEGVSYAFEQPLPTFGNASPELRRRQKDKPNHRERTPLRNLQELSTDSTWILGPRSVPSFAPAGLD